MSLPSGLAEHLFAVFEEQLPIETIQDALDSFEPPVPEPPKATKTTKMSQTKLTPAKTVSKTTKQVEEKHLCEVTVKPKDGSAPRACGNPAKNEVDGMWYCGTEKSGHYKAKLAKAGSSAPATQVAPKSVSVKGVVATEHAAGLVKRKVVGISALDIQPVANTSFWYSPSQHNILIDKETHECYGVLSKDKKKKLPLTPEAIAFCESHNIPIKNDTKAEAKPPAKAPPAKVTKPAPAKPQPAKVAPAKPAPAKPKAPAKPSKKAVPEPEPEPEELEEQPQDDAEDAGDEEVVADVDMNVDDEPETEETAANDGEEEQDGEADIEEQDEGEAVEDDVEEQDGDDE